MLKTKLAANFFFAWLSYYERETMTTATVRVLVLSLAIFALAGCGGGNSDTADQAQITTQSLQLRHGSVMSVAVGGNSAGQLQIGTQSQVTPSNLSSVAAGSTGAVKTRIRLSVSDSTIGHVSPSTCVISPGASTCTATLTGKKVGSFSILAQAETYADVSSAVSVTGVASPYGTISVVEKTQTFYSGANVSYPFSIMVQLNPATGTDSKQVSTDNPLWVMMDQPAGITLSGGGQCSLTTMSPSCTITGTIDATKVSSKTSFTTKISPIGTWVAGDNAPFGPQDDVTITWNGTAQQTAGKIHVATQNASGQIYHGMKAPLFVYLTDDTLLQSAYTVTVTSADPTALVFYSYPDGSNSNSSMQTSNSITCKLSLDNSNSTTLEGSVTSCGYGLLPLMGAAGNGLDITLNVTVATEAPTPSGYTPSYQSAVYLTSVDNSASTDGRTITFTNNSSDTVVVVANAGTASAYTSPTSVASGGDPLNPARNKAGAQSYCGTTALGKNACPIGSTCVQGGAVVSTGKTPFMCFWDNPGFKDRTGIHRTGILPSGSSATQFIPHWSGITSGGQQIQWSGNYYALQCPGGTCPSIPTTPGTGPTYAANTLAEVTYQHNTVDYYDVSIINGVNYALAFGPTSGQGVAPTSKKTYSCGVAGSNPYPGGYLPNSTWNFAPSASSSFPPGQSTSDSPASYFAVVAPSTTSTTSATSCTKQSKCAEPGASGNVCGWNQSDALTGRFTFDPNKRVCGNFVSWATANQIWGWNKNTVSTYLNIAPFDFATRNAIDPAFVISKSPKVEQSSISVGDLQLCINNSFSPYTNPAPTGQPVVMACGGSNWAGITTPEVNYTTEGPAWVKYVLPTITWLKNACPTCYTYPFDDMSSTFTCEKGVVSIGSNNLNYTINISDLINTLN